MAQFLTKLSIDFFVAFGIVLGGSLLGGIGATIILQPPAIYMERIAGNIKIWAMVAAVGGTIDPLRVIEFNITEGYLSPAIKQILYFIGAFIGAQMGFHLVQWICRGSGQP
ncbi:sporulation membrane protein YtrH [Paenibacillus sp. J31TS4]|uniref:YtrH family sporulation protein n=1 Tax=Paenibacillus sp. J31TS4 TaxID=2807195 RepID=UPI001B0F1712|nr:YtrH family sporulation protein [Paenibacillus sp. J31TS4]GIP38254.1 sporulation membrane protein YtrH [Paenibacillus sp. J31TS4]